MKRGLVILGLLCALTLSACAGDPQGTLGSSPPPWASIWPRGRCRRRGMTTGGFHGDGARWVVISLAGTDQAPAFSQEAGWYATPLPGGIGGRLVWPHPGDRPGEESVGPYLPRGGVCPQVESGYYFFQDRHRRSGGPRGPPTSSPGMHITSPPPSMTPGSETLYYYELDT